MVSQIKVNEIIKQSGSSITIGESGDTVSVPSGATLNVAGSTSGLPDNTPRWFVRQTGNLSLSDNTSTKVTWNQEDIDTDNAFASDKFTVPSGGAGTYFIFTYVQTKGSDLSYLDRNTVTIYKNGSNIAMTAPDFRSNPPKLAGNYVSTVHTLAEGDYIEVYVTVDVNSGSASYEGGDFRTAFGGYKLL